MISIDAFEKRHVIREAASLSSGRLVELFGLRLPMNSLIHYMTDSPADIGIRGSHPLIQGVEENISLAFVDTGYGKFGSQKKKSFNKGKFVRAFRAQQKRFTVRNDPVRAVRNPKELAIFDYSTFLRAYSYIGKGRFYDEWRNTVSSITSMINDPNTGRNHFIPVKLPSVLPTFDQYVKAMDEFTTTELETWTTDEHFWTREIFMLMAGMQSNLLVKNLDRVYFVLMEGNKAAVVNAGDLTERGEDKLRTLYNLMNKLVETRTVADSDAIEGEEESTVSDSSKDKAAVADERKEVIPGVPNTVVRRLVELGESGKLTAAEQRRFLTIAAKSDTLDNPFGKGTIKEARTITPAMTEIKSDLKAPINTMIVPEHARVSTISRINKSYIENGVYQADILNMLKQFNTAGVLIQDVTIEDKLDAVNDFQTLKVKLVPVNGKQSTISIDLPHFNEDGSFKIDGVKNIMDAQKVDAPLRKVSAFRCAITSYAGKLFIQRSQLAKYDSSAWIVKKISGSALDASDRRVSNAARGSAPIPKNVHLPRAYTALMGDFTSFDSGKNKFFLDYAHREEKFGIKEVKAVEKKGHIVCGKGEKGLLTMDMDGNVHTHEGKASKNLGEFMDVLGGNWGRRPVDYVELMNLRGARIPIILALAYQFGLTKALRMIKAKYRTEPSNVRATTRPNEFAVNFKDERLIVDLRDPIVNILIPGFAVIDKISKDFRYADMNRKDVYSPLLGAIGIEKFQINELDIIYDMFIDPITKEVLEEMNEPTDIDLLFVRCAELVITDEHPDETDPEFMRERRMERISGFLYKHMLTAIKEQRNKPNPSIHPVYIGPRDLWRSLGDDQTSQLVKELNPIHTLKEEEAVSLSGEGGRSAVSLVKSSRVFNPKDVGRYSEATPDSGKVGIRTFAPPNAKIKSVRGMHGDFDFKRDGATSVISTTALVLPAMHNDD